MHVSLLLVLKESVAARFACLCVSNHVDLCAQVCIWREVCGCDRGRREG